MQDSWEAAEKDFRFYLKTDGKSGETIRTYTGALALFWRWCAADGIDARTVDTRTIRQYLSERSDMVSSLRVHNDLAALKHFFRMLKLDRIRDDLPTEHLSIKRTRTLPTEPVSYADLDRLLCACTNERDRLIILVLAYTGMRISECAGIQAEHINWRHGTIRIRGKGDKEREVEPNPEIMGRLHAFLGMFHTGPIWLSQKRQEPLSAHQIRKIIYRLCDKAGIDRIHPHQMRSYFGTSYIEQFKDIHALASVMGHASIETTARYAETTQQRRGREQTRRFSLRPSLLLVDHYEAVS